MAPNATFLRQPTLTRADPGASVVTALGGPARVARLLGIAPSTPMRWGLPKSRPGGGTGGVIPERYHARLRVIAERDGVRIDLDAPPASRAKPQHPPVLA